MDLTHLVEHELRDSNYQEVGKLRLVDANEMGQPEATR
jgi:hypothetical protein